MSGDPYTPKPMEPARAPTEPLDSRFDGLHAEAKAAVGYSANTLRSVRERYREAYAEALGQWQALRDAARRGRPRARRRRPQVVEIGRCRRGPRRRRRRSRRRGRPDDGCSASDVDVQTVELGDHQAELARLELAERTLERTWLFLERRDATLVAEADGSASSGELKMRIVEAQEAERSRLAQEIHDGPAQVARQRDLPGRVHRAGHRDATCRSPGPSCASCASCSVASSAGVRAFISQLRPPLLDELGLDGAIVDTVEHMRTLTGLTIADRPRRRRPARCRTASRRPPCGWPRKPCRMSASTPRPRWSTVTTVVDGDDWVLEVRDDGRGFDVGAVAARGRRNFGLQFMRERAELIGARFDVRSRPDGGTVVRLAIPTGATTGGDAAMSAMDYSGPDRRRGGPDRRALGEITKILVVDDHALFRVGIANILGREPDFEIVAEAEDSRGAIDRALETSPDIILMDLSLPAPGGIETTQRIKRELPSTAIVVLAARPRTRTPCSTRSRPARRRSSSRTSARTTSSRSSAGSSPASTSSTTRSSPSRPSRRASSRSSASWPSTARTRRRSSRRCRRARSRSSTTSPRA